MKAVAFTDPGVVDLISSKFVPLRMCSDAESGAALGIKSSTVRVLAARGRAALRETWGEDDG